MYNNYSRRRPTCEVVFLCPDRILQKPNMLQAFLKASVIELYCASVKCCIMTVDQSLAQPLVQYYRNFALFNKVTRMQTQFGTEDNAALKPMSPPSTSSFQQLALPCPCVCAHCSLSPVHVQGVAAQPHKTVRHFSKRKRKRCMLPCLCWNFRRTGGQDPHRNVAASPVALDLFQALDVKGIEPPQVSFNGVLVHLVTQPRQLIL